MLFLEAGLNQIYSIYLLNIYSALKAEIIHLLSFTGPLISLINKFIVRNEIAALTCTRLAEHCPEPGGDGDGVIPGVLRNRPRAARKTPALWGL